MNLWNLFPEFILRFNGILQLPYLALSVYLYVFYATAKNAGERKYLMVFLLLTLVASVIMLLSLRAPVGKVIPPLALLSVMVMPFVMLAVRLYNRDYNVVRIWFMVTLAGWLHSISWSVWLFALAGS